MKNILLIALFSTVLIACVEVKFEQPQPAKTKSLSEFPQELQGKYLMASKDSLNENDTLTISVNYFTELPFGDQKEKKHIKTFISDSLIIKQIDENYTINFPAENYWGTVVLKPIKDYGYAILWIDGDDEATVEQVNLTTKMKTEKNDDGEIEAYILNPKKKEFKKMVSNKIIFKEMSRLKKIED